MKKELEGKPKVINIVNCAVHCSATMVQGLNVVTDGETYHYCYLQLDEADERYK